MSIVKMETGNIEPILEKLYGKKGTVERNAYDAEVQTMFDGFIYEPRQDSSTSSIVSVFDSKEVAKHQYVEIIAEGEPVDWSKMGCCV